MTGPISNGALSYLGRVDEQLVEALRAVAGLVAVGGLLALNAEGSPRHRGQPLGADVFFTVQADSETAFLNAPERFRSKSTKWEFNVDKANQILDGAGWKRGSDGIRAKDGVKLKVVYQTSINAPRQKTQAIVKQAASKAGIEMELKSVTPSVYFSSDAANPDTARKFYADLQLLTTGVGSPPDPEGLMRQFLSSEIAAKENKWQRGNATRWRNERYDSLFHAAEGELDPIKRAALFIAMNDMVVEDGVVIPVVCRPQVSAMSKKLRATLSGWDNTFWNLKDWYREA